MSEKNLKNIFEVLDELLNEADLSDVTAESSGFAELKDGYYLCEVVKAEIKVSKSSGQPMAAFQFKVVEDGHFAKHSIKNKPPELIRLKGSKGRSLFKYWVFKDEQSVRYFTADMLKFEGDTPGEPLLTKEYFMNSELVEDALDLLIGMQVYIHQETKGEDDNKSTWANVISWKVASSLGLPS